MSEQLNGSDLEAIAADSGVPEMVLRSAIAAYKNNAARAARGSHAEFRKRLQNIERAILNLKGGELRRLREALDPIARHRHLELRKHNQNGRRHRPPLLSLAAPGNRPRGLAISAYRRHEILSGRDVLAMFLAGIAAAAEAEEREKEKRTGGSPGALGPDVKAAAQALAVYLGSLPRRDKIKGGKTNLDTAQKVRDVLAELGIAEVSADAVASALDDPARNPAEN